MNEHEAMSRLWDQLKEAPQKEPELAMAYSAITDSWEMVNIDPPRIEEYG